MRGGKRAAGAALALAITGALCAQPALAADPPKPNPVTQPPKDGCQRNPVGLLTFTSPHWVSIYKDATPRMADGIATDSHVAAGDLPQGHDWYDLNFNLALDRGFGWLEGGSAATNTGNAAEGGDLHIEREFGKTPREAWPTENDRVRVWGTWVWDCGHWGEPGFGSDPTGYFIPGHGQVPGDTAPRITGEGTEFHPWHAIAASRRRPFVPVVRETQTDAFISTDGTIAAAESKCAREHQAPGGQGNTVAYGPDFTACHENPSSRHQRVNHSDYSFFVPAPPKPSKSARLRYRVVNVATGRAPAERVTERSNGIQVTVPFKGFGSNTETQRFAKSFFVGWEGDQSNRPSELEVELKRVKVNNALDTPGPGTSSQVPPGEYGLEVDVAGVRRYLNDWAPGLNRVMDGQEFDLNRKLFVRVPRGAGVRVYGEGRECDLPKINPCPATAEVAEDNDNPGSVAVDFTSASDALGDHVLKPRSGHWELTYTVRKAPPGKGFGIPRPGAPGPSCFDTFGPSSRPSLKRLKASRRGLLVRGTARDRGCGGKVRRTTVAVAKRVGKRCKFLEPGKRWSARRSCRKLSYLNAKGTSAWRFSIKKKLNRGKYFARSKAMDAVGNVETKDRRRRQLIRFRINR